MIQKPADRGIKKLSLHIPEFSLSLPLSSYKQKCPCQSTKVTTMYCLMVKLSVFQNACTGSNPGKGRQLRRTGKDSMYALDNAH